MTNEQLMLLTLTMNLGKQYSFKVESHDKSTPLLIVGSTKEQSKLRVPLIWFRENGVGILKHTIESLLYLVKLEHLHISQKESEFLESALKCFVGEGEEREKQ